MKVSKNKLKHLIENAIKKNLVKEEKEESEFGDLVGEVTRSVTNSKGGKVKIPSGYYKMPGTEPLTSEKGDPYEYIALINSETLESAYMPIMDKNGGVDPKLNVGRVFDKGTSAHTKLEKRYQSSFPQIKSFEKELEDVKNKINEMMSSITDAEERRNMTNHITSISLACQLYAGIGSTNILTGDAQKDVEILELMSLDSAEKLRSADPFYKKMLYSQIKKEAKTKEQIDSAKQFLGALNIKEPSKSELAKSSLYNQGKESIEKAGGYEEIKSAIAGEKEESNESREINENRIRAIIRHELIQSMKK